MCTTNPCYIHFLPSTNLCQTKLWSMVKLCFRSWWKPQLCEVWVWFGHMLIFCKYWLDGYHVMIEQRLLTGLLKADKDQLKTMCRPTTSTTTCLLLRTEIEKRKTDIEGRISWKFCKKVRNFSKTSPRPKPLASQDSQRSEGSSSECFSHCDVKQDNTADQSLGKGIEVLLWLHGLM